MLKRDVTVFQAYIVIGEIAWRMQPGIRPFAYVLQRISGSHDLVAETAMFPSVAACVSGVYRDRLSNRVANVSLSSSVAYCVYRDHWGHGASPEMGPSVAVILQYIGISKISWRRPRAIVRAKFAHNLSWKKKTTAPKKK